MTYYEDDPLEEAYFIDPEGVTARVIADAASAAAAQVAMFHDSRRDAELARVRQGQIESATITAKDALDQKYGKESVDRLLPNIAERIAASPHLVPESVQSSRLSSPTP